MTQSEDVAARALAPEIPTLRPESGSFLRGFVGSAVLLFLISAAEPLFFSEGYFSSLVYHPFWIVILLAAVQHGLFVGLSIVGLATLLMDWPSRPVGVDIADHYLDIAAAPAQWLTVALIIGLYRQQQIRRDHELVVEAERLRSVNQTLVSEIHRLDAYVARAELAAATRDFATPKPQNASGTELIDALDRLSRADAVQRPQAFVAAARACTDSPIAWYDLDQGSDLRLAATTHEDLSVSEKVPSGLLDPGSDRLKHFAPGEGPAPVGYHAIFRALDCRDGGSGGGVVALSLEARDLDEMEPALAVLGRALESSLRDASIGVAPITSPVPTSRQRAMGRFDG